jgi:hypothetical protein
VTDVAQFVNTLGSGCALFAIRIKHLINQIRNVIERRGLAGGSSFGDGLMMKESEKLLYSSVAKSSRVRKRTLSSFLEVIFVSAFLSVDSSFFLRRNETL